MAQKFFKAEGPYSHSYQAALKLAEQYSVYNVTTTFLNPYAMEGDKLVGYELYEILGRMPDFVYMPVGAGPLLGGIHKALCEYAALNHLPKTAGIVAMQAEGNSPIAQAFEKGADIVCSNPSTKTIADGIADGLVGCEQDGNYTLPLCRESAGTLPLCRKDNVFTSWEEIADKRISCARTGFFRYGDDHRFGRAFPFLRQSV